ncbi:MAG: ribonuclease III [Hyphomicrobiaceae bacterium]|nr:ribonuclease III [Hyphomicrobiaceae bacterium]
MQVSNKYAHLEQVLGQHIKNQKLLEQALTHASVRTSRRSSVDNERLEFLGDRVLGLAISAYLHSALPNIREGDLARRFNRLVCGESCASIARSIDLGRYLVLSESEAQNGGRDKSAILADAMEALLGAIFLDGGFEAAKKVIERLWYIHFNGIGITQVDAKSALQEWVQGQGFSLPIYKDVERSGPDHAPQFICEVFIEGHKSVSGSGTSKRQAHQAAAAALLVREGVWKKSS